MEKPGNQEQGRENEAQRIVFQQANHVHLTHEALRCSCKGIGEAWRRLRLSTMEPKLGLDSYQSSAKRREAGGRRQPLDEQVIIARACDRTQQGPKMRYFSGLPGGRFDM
jgi:hypothetical protein